MNRTSIEIHMMLRYALSIAYAPTEDFSKTDLEQLARIDTLLRKARDRVRRAELMKQALCSDPEKTTPHMSHCTRCPVISATPDGCGYMCGLTLRAVEVSDFNPLKADSLDSPKINPPVRTSETIPNLTRGKNSIHYGGYGNV